MSFLEIKDLHISIDGKQILTGLNLSLNKGEVHAIMGPNGSGKSTLANAIMGHPKYSIDSGDILVKGESILNLSTDLRARKGLFLGFQYPTEIPGVGYSHFLRNAYNTLTSRLARNKTGRSSLRFVNSTSTSKRTLMRWDSILRF